MRKIGATLWGTVGLLALAAASLVIIAPFSDRVGVAIERRKALQLDLAFEEKEIAPKKAVPDEQNAWTVFREIPPMAVLDDEKPFLAVLDGRIPRGGFGETEALIRSLEPELALYEKGAGRASAWISPTYSNFLLTEFEPLRKACLALCARAVLLRRPSDLEIAARIAAHLGQSPFLEAATAHAWARLYVLKASDRLGKLDEKLLTTLGHWPDLRRSLRGELVHDIGLARSRTRGLGLDPQNGPVESRLVRFWQRWFPQIPGGQKYTEAATFFDGFERRRRSSRFPRGYNREGYAQLARLLDEGVKLEAKLRS